MQAPSVDPPPPATRSDGNQHTSLAQRLCRLVLTTAQAADPASRITSVSRWEKDDSTLLRVRTTSAGPFAAAEALRKRWPLANVSIVENLVDGYAEAQILVPSGEEELERARALASSSLVLRRLGLLGRTLGLAAVLCFATMVTANAIVR